MHGTVTAAACVALLLCLSVQWCGAGAVERQCRERQDEHGAPLPLAIVEGTIASTLTSMGLQFSLNVKTPDGLLRLDCLLHHHLTYAASCPWVLTCRFVCLFVCQEH
jgi:hypothetical protein